MGNGILAIAGIALILVAIAMIFFSVNSGNYTEFFEAFLVGAIFLRLDK